MKLICLLVLSLSISYVLSNSAGPPLSGNTNFNRICTQMTPMHGSIAPQSGNGGYTITTDIPRSDPSGYSYAAGQTYTVTLRGADTFLGFLVIAHVPGQNNMLLGSFMPQSNQQTLQCDPSGAATQATVAHSNSARAQFSNMMFMWQAPSGSDGTVDFRYTVVRNLNQFYVLQSAALNDPLPMPTTPPPTLPPGQTTMVAPTASDETQPPETTQPPPGTPLITDGSTTAPTSDGSLTAPVIAPENYRLTFRDPSNCAPSECRVFVGIDTNSGNSSYLDIYLEGEAGGWVAVGFSTTPSMPSADVVACNRNPTTDMVEALDTWNIEGSFNNEVDTVQDVQMFSGSQSNGRIKCSVAKKIAPSSGDQDLDLNKDYYVLYGRRRGDSFGGVLSRHEIGAANNPLISAERVNPVTAGGSVGADTFPRVALLRFHGILMIVAWPLLALCGIFFAAWMRPALPNGEWFQVHRAFLLASMFVGVAGFIVAFIAHSRSSTPGLINLGPSNPAGTAHFALGIIVMLLHIINPIISALRCKPTGEFRWIFNLAHATIIGTLAEVTALANVALGTYLLFRRYTSLFGVFITYVILNFIMFVVLTTLFTLISCLSKNPNRKNLAPSLTKALISSPGSGEKVVMSELEPGSSASQTESATKINLTDDSQEEQPKKVPSEDSPIRWASFIVYIAVSTALMIALIGLTAGLN